jgi:hypothetical protein
MVNLFFLQKVNSKMSIYGYVRIFGPTAAERCPLSVGSFSDL